MAKKKQEQAPAEEINVEEKLSEYESALRYVFKYSGERGIVNFVGQVLGINMEEFHASNAVSEENGKDSVSSDDASEGAESSESNGG